MSTRYRMRILLAMNAWLYPRTRYADAWTLFAYRALIQWPLVLHKWAYGY